MASEQALTLSEAGYVLGRSTSGLNKAVDTGEIRARQRKIGKVVERLLGPAELRFLRLADELDKDLTPAGRRRLYDALRKLSADKHRVRLGELELDLARIDTDLKSRVDRLRGIRQKVEMQRGRRDAVIRGTRVSAHLIAALARTQTIGEILEDFPSLDRAQVDAAIEYAKAYPKRGRPYAARSLKRTLSDLAELGVFEETEGNEETAPRKIP
ncbi:MAG: DUF433 domain-containing protein [Parvibaculaceae bacterium]